MWSLLDKVIPVHWLRVLYLGVYNTFPLCLYGNSIVYWLMVGTSFSVSGLPFCQPYKEVGQVGGGTVSQLTFLSVLWAVILSPLLRKPPDMIIKSPMSSLSPVLPPSFVALLQDTTVYLVVCYGVGNPATELCKIYSKDLLVTYH